MLNLLLLALLGQAGITLDVKPAYKVGEPIVLAVKGAADSASIQWELAEGVTQLAGDKAGTIHCWAKPGKYSGRCYVIDWNKKDFLIKPFTVKVEGATPTPDPEPDPDDPPAPDEKPPFACTGLHVLIVTETDGTLPMTTDQYNIIYGLKVRNWLESVTPVGPDGKTHTYRIYDRDLSGVLEEKVWQDALAVKRGDVPWLLVSNGKTGFSGKLPTTEAEFRAILTKHKGS